MNFVFYFARDDE